MHLVPNLTLLSSRSWLTEDHSYKLVRAHTQVKINKSFQRTIVNVFFPLIFNKFWGCSKEPSH